jgi:hypothetical protein
MLDLSRTQMESVMIHTSLQQVALLTHALCLVAYLVLPTEVAFRGSFLLTCLVHRRHCGSLNSSYTEIHPWKLAICRQVYARRASCLVRPRHYTSIPIAIWMEYLWDFVFEFSLHLAYSYNYVVQTHYALILTLGPWCTNSQDVPLTS